MRKDFYKYIVSLIFAILASCNSRDEIVFHRVENIIVDTIPIQQIFAPTFITLTNDILTVTSYSTSPMLHFYKLPSLSYIYSTGKKGQGPGEIQQFPMICQSVSSDNLYIWGYTAREIREFAFKNDSISLVKIYDLDKYETFNQLHVLQDSLFIYSAIPSDFSIKKYDLKANCEVEKIVLKTKGDQPFYSPNYGFVAANDSCIVYAYNYKKQIDIYDVNTLKLTKRIIDRYNYTTPALDDNNNNVMHYISVVAGEKYFYALYRGRSEINSTENSDIMEVYDYNGNPVSKYTFTICPQIFIVDEVGHFLYGFSYHYQDYLLKCRL